MNPTDPKRVLHETAVQRYLSVNAVAQHFGVSKMSIYRAIDTGQIEAVRIGRNIRIPATALATIAAEHTIKPGELGHAAQTASHTEARRAERGIA